MLADCERLNALRQGLTHCKDDGYVTVRVADLRWLIDRAEGSIAPEPLAFDEPQGEFDEPERI